MSAAAGAIVLAGRLMFAWFFGPVAGVGHVRRDPMMRQGASSAGFPIPAIAGWPTGLWLVVGSVSVALGIWPDVGALMIAAFLIPAAAYFHRFWAIEDQTQRRTQQTQFYRNLIGIAACAVMFGTFVTLGSELRFSITGPLFQF